VHWQNCEKQLLASSCLFDRPSFHVEQLSSTGPILMEFDIWVFFWKCVKKIQVSLKCDKNIWYSTWRPLYICSEISLNSQNEKCLGKNVVEKIKTHFVFFCVCVVRVCVCVWKLWCLWDNVEKYGTARQATDDSIIQCMYFACWIAKATYTLKMCNNYCSSTATVVLWMYLNVIFICTLPVLYFSVFSIPLNVLFWELSGSCNQEGLCSEILVPLNIIILCNKKSWYL